MAVTYSLISSNTLGASAASVTFSSIPQTYTDLLLKVSARNDTATNLYFYVIPNNTQNVASYTRVNGSGTTVSSDSGTTQKGYFVIGTNLSTQTSNTFGNAELYIPSYTSSTNKPASVFGVVEDNASTGNGIAGIASLWSSTSAISSLVIQNGLSSNFVSGSSFYLYGIVKS